MRFSLFTFICLTALDLYAACGDNQACLSAPEGLLKDNAKVKGMVGTTTWIVTGVSLLGTIAFMINAGKKLNEQDYMGAVGPIVGSCLCGISTFLAHTILN